MRWHALALMLLVSLACDPPRATTIGSGFDESVYVAARGDELLVVERAGVVRRLSDGGVWLDISPRVSTDGEAGLLSIALDGPRVFAYYVSAANVSTVSRFDVAADGRSALAGSEVRLLEVQQSALNHKGGTVALGPDGFLYLGLGDGGTAANAQDPGTLLGKLLRVDPVTGSVTAIGRGLRNPYRFSFDRETGDLWIGDVGAAQVEEIDQVTADELAAGGLDFGWPAWEGTRCNVGPCTNEGRTFPVYEYGHAEGCSVTGGHVHRGSIPWLHGVYLFGDLCAGKVWGLLDGRRIDVSSWAGLASQSQIVALEPDAQGRPIVVRFGGRLLRIE